MLATRRNIHRDSIENLIVFQILGSQKHAWEVCTNSRVDNKTSGLSVSGKNAQPASSNFIASAQNHAQVNAKKTHLIVNVGDGIGEENEDSDSGIFIFKGAKSLARGGLGTRFGVFSLTSDVNRTLIFVEGNLRTPLKTEVNLNVKFA